MSMIDVLVPEEQEGTKAVVRGWLKQVGDSVRENDPLVELETDKVTQEVPAPAAGILAEILLDSDAEAEPGALLARIDTEGKAAAAAAPSPETKEEAPEPAPAAPTGGLVDKAAIQKETRLSPAVRRACLQHDLDPSCLEGTGRGGRVTLEDVKRVIAEGPAIAVSSAPFSAEDIPHDRMRRTIAENMVRAVSDAPHVTALFECDFSAVAEHKAAMKVKGVKLSYTAYIVKAAAEAMAAAPAINGRWEEDRIAISPTIDIGVGTALGEKGLVVPVVKDADSLSLKDVGARLDDLTTRAREGRLDRKDVAGGSFTISNHGVSGSLLAAPIILHQGQAAILGVGKLEKRVVVRELDGQDVMVIRPMAYVTLTIDHRVVDGHQTNAWLSRFVEIMENWPQA
ncbi:dihydrolipoamide acetyltransferase family protein [Sphingomicrobium lutaoense]|uniref:Dihydrolipoamide acetyltransferase component of pyruvate dehydrogenase complex n=1 Tax=Sphingomicrobium lutaoense TaxID=515949 RepID=A0A839YYH2_9SPHN|nr:2-oxo acid dehydrogenase subunit E2 [Sphingomicrobium lutaoense]MBB3764056.1 2-oxoglutarate dehydrogenase E2 component (dihydrolipoamide succinyltransferase) [Sphingomicrobium lutaoense]